MLRSLETLKIRMERQCENAQKVAAYLNSHPKVSKVYYLGLIEEGTNGHQIYKRQYNSPGAMISFDIVGGEKAAFVFLNHLRLFKLAVSLGSTEGLAQHPATMTHVGIDSEQRKEMNVTENLIRLSIGVEDADDIVWDMEQAPNAV